MTADALPDSDDPFEVLGAQPGEDLVAIRRRYVQRIKAFRPEEHPEEFRRIRRAWEQVQASFQLGAAEVRFERAHEEEPAARPADARTAAAFAAVWTDVAEREADAARRRLEHLAARPRDRSRAWTHRFLLEETEGTPRPLRVLAKALEEDPGIASWATELLDPSELRELGGLLPEGWPILRRQEDPRAATRILRGRLHGLLAAGREAEAVAEVLDPRFREDVLDRPGLRRLAHEVALATAWVDPPASDGVLEAFPDPGDDEDRMLDHLLLARSSAPGWIEWAERHEDRESLQRFIRLSSIADPDEQQVLSANLWEDLMTHPDGYVRAFDALPEGAISVYLDQVEGLCAGQGLSEPPPPAGLADALREADRTIVTDRSHERRQSIAAYVVLASIGSFWLVGWWGIAVVVAALAAAMWIFWRADIDVYRRKLRPAIARYILETGVAPQQIRDGIERDRRSFREMDSHADRIATDAALVALHAATRLGNLRSPPGSRSR